ncbi:hypothetical protein BCM40_06560 [Planococcus donghaensis]|uniref:SAM-dependent methyltransferase n=2 Tax=Planococcus donghaensis TaxID=414778 RepID=A0A1C7ELY3_9BACL|nr:hypothetical protein BCM40_06560 [Planococcus donghaensis]
MQFIVEFMKQPKEIGAIAPSSIYLARKMTPEKLLCDAKVVVELGAGMGHFTEEIVRKKPHGCKVIVFETNPLFSEGLAEQYRSREDVLVLLETAENLPLILRGLGIEHVDLIVSGLPFSSFEIEKANTILNGVHEVLNANGTFLAFQYSKYRKKIFERVFGSVTHERELRNLPPAYVLECRKEL